MKQSTADPVYRIASSDHAPWKRELREANISLGELLDALDLSGHEGFDRDPDFPLRVTPRFIEKMQPGDAHDPLLRQILPTIEEYGDSGSLDPVDDHAATMTPGLIQKYEGRALLIATGACAVHCRYCFRRHYPYASSSITASNLGTQVDYLREDETIREVILSGGDPLMLSDDRIEMILTRLAEIPHIRWIRLHSRMPVVLPSRITPELLRILGTPRFRVTLVNHSNHANEIAGTERKIFTDLREAGITLLNQSVLLRGINDDPEVLTELSVSLHDAGVLPYYLHLLDPVRGAMHFDSDEEHARRIIRQLRERLPGFLVPALVREEPGQASKTAISHI